MFNHFQKQDDQIQKDVLSELNWDPSVDSGDIDAFVSNGIVTLTGRVPHFYVKSNAEDAARRVGGVRSVDDEIEVVPTETYTRTDAQIADTAQLTLDGNSAVPPGVKASVDGGWITLTGEVEWEYQRAAAENAIASLMGVRGIENDLSVKPKEVASSDVKTQIQDALKRSAATEGRKIEVSIVGDKVTLSGSLDSYAEIETARIAAWGAPGVSSVVNQLTLSQ
jgi:osmotically-inducible protein OsmY